jgi:hypothetical protein
MRATKCGERVKHGAITRHIVTTAGHGETWMSTAVVA